MFDEIHNGSSIRSIMSKVCSQWNNRAETRSIGITATPSELFYKEKWQICPLFLPTNYSGLRFYNGHQLPTLNPSTTIEGPMVLPIEETIPELEPFLTQYGRGLESVFEEEENFWTANKIHYAKHKFFSKIDASLPWTELPFTAKSFIRSEHVEFRRSFADAVARMYKRLAQPDSPIVFFRPFRKTTNCNALHKELLMQAAMDKHDVLTYYGELPQQFRSSTRKYTLKEVLIDRYVCGDNGNYCLILACSGRARMGDSFPSECKYYIDLYEVSATWNTVLQATYGRACGIGKKSVCYFSRQYCNSLSDFIDRECVSATAGELTVNRIVGGRRIKKFGLRDELIEANGSPAKSHRGRKPSTASFSFDENYLMKLNWKKKS
jgi:hypothetical protein